MENVSPLKKLTSILKISLLILQDDKTRLCNLIKLFFHKHTIEYTPGSRQREHQIQCYQHGKIFTLKHP